MQTDRDEIAARNNAEWCAAVWRAHGLPVDRAAGLWFCRGATPRFYPNAVTVDRAADPEDQAAFLADLRGQSPDPAFSVKDSFARLDLRAAGLTPLFAARWLWREPREAGPVDEGRWRRVLDPEALGEWECAWRGDAAAGPLIFRPGILSDARVSVIAGFGPTGAIESGGIANLAAGAVGVSNLFGPRGAVIAALAARFPALPLAGYESGEDLKAAVAEGFEVLGPLRVWASAA